ncbi:MAG: hypothetical protein GC152_15765 [Alphaproteobacteria bacterium]|nr:hypothetical protein [Alphaproteobacteria bacterium]
MTKEVKPVSKDVRIRPWTVDGAAAAYETSVKVATKKLARETSSSTVERAKNARDIAKAGRALAREYFGGKIAS